MVGELGERVVPGLGVAWGDVEACPGASDQEGGCQGNALAGQGVSLWHWAGPGVGGSGGVQGNSPRSALGGC